MPRTSDHAPRIFLTYGRFDMFHQGHVAFLRQASQLADELIVGCATDEFALKNGTPCYMPFDSRRDLLDSCRYVSRVIPQTHIGQHRSDIVNHNVGTLVLGPKEHRYYDNVDDIALMLYLPRHIPKQSVATLDDYRRKSS